MSDHRNYHALPVEALETALETNCNTGLTASEAANKLARDGPNELEKPKPPTLFILFVSQLVNVIMVLLIGSAMASLTIAATGNRSDDALAYVEGIAIFVIVFLNAAIAAVTENVANSALDALSKMSQAQARVIRDGKTMMIDGHGVVVGDLIALEVGDVVPADIRILDSAELKVNEMLLTGEPDDVAKTHKVAGSVFVNAEGDTVKKQTVLPESNPAQGEEKLTPATMAFSSCLVANGKGTGVVTDVAMNTRVGSIAKLLGGQQADLKFGCLPDPTANNTPLQNSLQELGMKIGYLAILVCVIVWVVGVLLDRQDETDDSKPSALYMTLVAVTLAVAAIPEGIPLCVTISLSSGANAMVERNVLVRRLAAVETLGSAKVICTDKTGTLTEGKMTMVKMWTGGQMFDVSGGGFDPHIGKVYLASDQSTRGTTEIPHSISGQNLDGLESSVKLGDGSLSRHSVVESSKTPGADSDDAGKTSPTVRSTLLAGLLCCNTTIHQDPATGFWAPKGNSSEAPIVVAAAKVGFWVDDIVSDYKRVVEIPFNSSRKMMVTVVQINNSSGLLGSDGIKLPDGTKYIIIVKGAPNIILDACNDWTLSTGEKSPFLPQNREDVMTQVDALSSQALRVLAIAIRCLPELPFDINDENLTSDDKFKALVHGSHAIRLMGLVASIDPAREGVLEAVHAANVGGIKVVMITGDYFKTALAIARNIKIVLPQDLVDQKTGEVLMKQDDEAKVGVDCAALRPNGDYIDEPDMDILTSRVKVFARAKPEDKLQIVQSLQRQGLVCAMTGDGVNDAPALKKSDIGVAMGIQGTDVAKGAADMILVDDNFVSIVGAVERGRVIYAGIQKFVAFIMSVHIGEVMQIFFCVVAGIPIMRKPLQILFLILVTDLPPAVALGMEPGNPGIMKEKPRPKTQPIVLKWMWQSILVNGFILSLVIVVVYILCLNEYVGELNQETISDAVQIEELGFAKGCLSAFCICIQNGHSKDDCNDDDDTRSVDMRLRQARTATFIAVVFAENVRAYTSRSFEKPFFMDMCSNIAMQKAIAIAQIALWIVVLVPGISDKIFELEGLSVDAFGYVAAVLAAIATITLCEIYKQLVKKQIRAFQKKQKEEEEQEEAERQQKVNRRESVAPRQSSGPGVIGRMGGPSKRVTTNSVNSQTQAAFAAASPIIVTTESINININAVVSNPADLPVTKDDVKGAVEDSRETAVDNVEDGTNLTQVVVELKEEVK